MTKKIISIVLALSILAILPLGVCAETTVQPRYTYVSNHSTTLIISNDIAYAESYVQGYSTALSIKMTLTLQKKTLWWWDDVTEWSDITPNSYLSMSESTSVGSGTYRVKMTARVCGGSGSNYEDIEGYSNEASN